MKVVAANIRRAFSLMTIRSNQQLIVRLSHGVTARAIRCLCICLLPSLVLLLEMNARLAPALGAAVAFLWLGWFVWERYELSVNATAEGLEFVQRPFVLRPLVRSHVALSAVVNVRKIRFTSFLRFSGEDGSSAVYLPDPVVHSSDGEDIYETVCDFALAHIGDARSGEHHV